MILGCYKITKKSSFWLITNNRINRITKALNRRRGGFLNGQLIFSGFQNRFHNSYRPPRLNLSGVMM
ncbi:hypothetical protein BGS_0302 [Beggiatoa sp. SS]|nr:hypothetical protein BGS_0302 [Beggiatoa sp. SS]